MNSRLKGGLVAAAAVAAIAGGGAAIAAGTGGSDQAVAPATGSGDEPTAEPTGGDDGAGQPIAGTALEKAKSVALQETGGGQVTATEIRDEEGYYEVEVTRDDGSNVDVHLDSHFDVLNKSADGEGGDGD